MRLAMGPLASSRSRKAGTSAGWGVQGDGASRVELHRGSFIMFHAKVHINPALAFFNHLGTAAGQGLAVSRPPAGSPPSPRLIRVLRTRRRRAFPKCHSGPRAGAPAGSCVCHRSHAPPTHPSRQSPLLSRWRGGHDVPPAPKAGPSRPPTAPCPS